MSVLILAEDLDPNVDLMIGALDKRGVATHRINTAWFPSQLTVSAEQRGEGWVGCLATPYRQVELEEITAVWYRSPQAYRFPGKMSDAERWHANIEAKYGIGGVLSSLPVLRVNHPSRLADSAYKPAQLATAARCGLTVPDTLITNDHGSTRKFMSAGATVTKLLGSATIAEESYRKIAFTRLLDDSDKYDLRGLEYTTHLFQRWVPKAWECRVIVIGAKLTAVAIHSDSAAGRVDWRTDYDNLRYELTDMPNVVDHSIRQLMESLELSYGALDFVVTPEGEWVFLEVNAGGQYGWLEDETGAPFTEQLADLLVLGNPT